MYTIRITHPDGTVTERNNGFLEGKQVPIPYEKARLLKEIHEEDGCRVQILRPDGTEVTEPSHGG